jgi:hypothetical protein
MRTIHSRSVWRCCRGAVFVALLSPLSLVAQSAVGALAVGLQARVRVNGARDALSGSVVALSRDSLSLLTDGETVTVGRDRISMLEVRQRRSRAAQALRTATVVTVIASAALMSSYSGDEVRPCEWEQDAICATRGGDIWQAVSRGLFLSVYGQPFGALFPGTRWVRVASAPTVSASATAVGSPPATPGTRLRLTAVGHSTPHFEGTLVAWAPDSVTVAVRGDRVVKLPTASIVHVERSVGSDRWRGARRGLAQITPLLLSFASIDWEAQAAKEYRNDVRVEEFQVTAGRAVLAHAMLASIGMGIGALIAPPRWQEAPAPVRLSITPDQSRRVLHVGLTRRF